MPINSPFDVMRRGRSPALPQVPDAPQSDDDSADDGASTYAAAKQFGQQQVIAEQNNSDQQAATDFSAQQQQQAAQDAAAQKAQQAQDKIDSANQAVQDKVDADNLKANGAVTQAAVSAGPDGKARVIQQQQLNPDGTGAYKPADLGIMAGPDGTPYSVSRTQWGSQQWDNPYGPAKANLKLTPGGQIMATPKGKGAADLPQKDVTDQGVTTDAQGNITVDPNAPINAPQLQPQIDSQEQALVKQAATQQVKDTVKSAADDATQKAKDAASDYAEASSQHEDAKTDLKTATENRYNAPPDNLPDGAPNPNETAYQSAVTAELNARNARITAGKSKQQASVDAAAQADTAKKAAADPLAFLQQQSLAESQAAATPPPAPTSSGTAQPSDNAGGSLSSPSAQSSPNPPATGAVPDSNPPPPAAPPPAPAPIDPNATDPNTITGLITGQYGKPNPSGPNAPPPGMTVIHPMSATQDFINNFDQDFTNQSIQLVGGLSHLSDAIDKSWLNPGHWINAGVKALTGYDQDAKLDASQKQLDDLLAKGQQNVAQIYPTDESRTDSLSRKGSGLAANVLPMLASGPTKLGQLATNIYLAVSGAEATREDVKARGGSDAAADTAGATTGVVYGLANKIFGPFAKTFEKFLPGASPTVTKAAINFVVGGGVKSAQGATEMGLMNAANASATDLALDASGAPMKDGKGNLNRVDPIQATTDGLVQGALFRGLLHPGEFAAQEYNNMKVGDALNKQGAQAAFVQSTAKAFQGVDIAQSAGHITPEKAQVAKDELLHFLTPDNQVHVQAHVDNVTAAQTQSAQVMLDAAKQIHALGAPDADLKTMPDAQLLTEHSDVTNRLQQTPGPNTPDPTLRPGLPKATPDYQGKVADEIQRRSQIADIQNDAQSKLNAIADHLTDATTATQNMARKPGGTVTLRELNTFNNNIPVGSPKADAITAQSASDMAPQTSPGHLQPTLEHYLPVSHAIELLGDPDQQTMATAALKMTNGRALNSSEQSLMFGDPGTNQAPAHDSTTGAPFAKQVNGKTIMTDAGLARLRNLLPQAGDILPRSEQAQLEAQPPPLPGKGTNPLQKGTASQPPPLNNGLATQLAGVRGSEPDPELAKVDDETLQVRHDNATAAIGRAKERGGDVPPRAYVQRDKLAAEIARRRSAIAPAETGSVGAAEGAKEGDEINYSRPNHEGQPVATRGEVTEVHPDHYRVVDAHDGVERTVPKYQPESESNDPKNVSRVSDGAANPERAAGEGKGATGGGAGRDVPPGAGGHRTAQEGINLPGLDTSRIAPEHTEAAGLLSDTYAKMKPLFDALGLDPSSTFVPEQHDEGTIGLGVSLADPNHIQIDLARLAQNFKAPELNTPGKKMARMEAVLEEEAIHIAGEKVLGKDSDSVHEAIWRSLSDAQREKVIDHYGGYLRKADEKEDDGLDANRGREYIRMLVQLERSGRTTEWSNKLSGATVSYLTKAVNYLKSLIRPGNQAVADLVKRIQNILDKGTDDDHLDMSPPLDNPTSPANGQHATEPVSPRAKPAPLTDEEFAAQEKARKELMTQAFGDRDSLLDVVKKVGGIPTTDPALQGELENVKQGRNKGTMMQFFRKSAMPLDRLREALSEKGFHFDTPAEMLDKILDSIRTGKPVYGSATDQLRSDRLDRQIEMTGKSPQELTPVERGAVVGSAKRISQAADGLRKVLGGGEVFGGQPEGESLNSPRGQHGTEPESDQARRDAEAAASRGSPEAAAHVLGGSARPDEPGAGGRQEAAGLLVRNKLLAANRLRAQQELEYTDLADRLGLLHDDEGIPEGAEHIGQGVEHQVFHKAGDNFVTKLTKPHEYGISIIGHERATPESYLTRLGLQNRLFGDDIKWKGINGVGQTVTTQPFHERLKDKDGKVVTVSYPEIAKSMGDAGFVPTGVHGEWRNASEGVTVSDAHPRNFVKDAIGRVHPIDLQIRRDTVNPQDQAQRRLFGSAVVDRPEVERPLARYVSALKDGELNLHDPGELNFTKEYQTDMGQSAPESLVDRAKELEVQQPEPEQATTPEQLFGDHLPVADRLASAFHNIHGIESGDAQQVARTALATAADGYDPERGVPFRGYASAVIRNALRDEYRKQSVRSVEQPTLDAPLSRDKEGLEATGKDYLEAPEPTASHEVAQKDAHGQLRDYIQRVSMEPGSRRVLNSFLDGRDQNEIANELKVSKQRVGFLIGSGLEQLRKVFAEKGIKRSDLIAGGSIPESEELPGSERITPEDLQVDHDGSSWHEARDNYDPDEPSTWPFAKSDDLDTYKTELDSFDKDDPDTWDSFLPTAMAGEHGNVTELADDTAGIAERLESQEGVHPAVAKKARQLADEVRSQVDDTIRPVAERNAGYVKDILDQAKSKADAYFKDSDDPDVNLARTDIDMPDEWPQEWRDDYDKTRRDAGIADGDYEHPKLPEVNESFDAKYKPLIEAARQRVAAREDKPEQGTLFGGAVKDREPEVKPDRPLPAASPKGVAKLFQDVKDIGDGAMQVFSPHLRGEDAAWTARSLSANLAEAALEHYRNHIAFESARQLFARKSIPESLAFIDSIEQGTPIADPALNAIAQKLRARNDVMVAAARGVPSKQFKGYIENYFPHIFKQADLEKAQAFYRRKIEGSRAFLKHRSIPTIAEAIKAGLELESHNPIDLFLKRWGDMGKFVAAQKMINEGRDADVFHERPNDADILPGEVKIDPKIGYSTEEVPDRDAIEKNRQARENPDLFRDHKPLKETMQRFVPLYASEQAARVLNNYLSPGLRNHPNAAVSKSTRALMTVGNLMNSAQLGLSAFHLGFTTTDTMVSKLALGLEQFEQGQGLKGLQSMASLPKTPFTNLMQGHKLLAELKHPGSQGPEMAALADMVTAGGGRAGLDPVYSDQWCKAFMDAIHGHDVLGALGRAPFAGIEMVGVPIMKWLVPRQKLGVFADLARHEMDKLGPDATQDDKRSAMQKAWASVDNRMGQLVYDNLHMSKVAKDALMVGTRSVGWNIGTFRELGGGYLDGLKYAANKVQGKDADFTHRMAYTLALHLLLAGMGTLTGYLLTGRRPESVTDAFFPKTGEKDAAGHDARIAFPSYVKDEAAYLHAPIGTLENKANPLLSVLFQLYNNKDYYGTQIRNPGDPVYQQVLDDTKFAGKEMEPFGIQGGNKFSEATPAAAGDQGPLTHAVGPSTIHSALKAAPFFGMTPASAYLSTSPAEQRASEIEDELHASDTKNAKDALRSQTKNALREQLVQAGKDPAAQAAAGRAIWAAVQAKTILRKDAAKIHALAQVNNPLQRMVKGIGIDYRDKDDKETGYQKIRSIYDKASPAEQRLIYPTMMPLWGEARGEGADVGPQPPPPTPLPASPVDKAQ
jgi:RNA polymerase sigma factor (sigma-70 family)